VIKVDTIEIREFRGIRKLTLKPNGKNFAVAGPNGTGKSGVVDALEFVLTGSISRLAGEGRGEVSVRSHAPHVDSRDAPEKSWVSATVSIPSIGKSATITRNVRDARKPIIDPPDADVLAVLQIVGAHPEFVLSRRELIRYVLATPGKRADEVQSLLHLDDVEKVRTALQRIANADLRKAEGLRADAREVSRRLAAALGVASLTKESVLKAVNARRALLRLPLFTDIVETTNFKDGVEAAPGTQPSRVPKKAATDDLKTLRDLIAGLTTGAVVAVAENADRELEGLSADPWVESSLARDDFYAKGLSLIEGDACPYCDKTWDPAALRHHIEDKRKRLEKVDIKRNTAVNALVPLAKHFKQLSETLKELLGYAGRMVPPVPCTKSREYGEAVGAALRAIDALLPIASTRAAIAFARIVPKEVIDEISAIGNTVALLPEPTKQDAARDWLTIAQERLEVYRDTLRRRKTADEGAKRSGALIAAYNTANDTILGGLYAHVQKDFAKLYASVNRSDEGDFAAELIPSLGKLGFNVDFYGKGHFPPGAYHSEGHQDGMGLCLYLALMRYLLGKQFTFAVLDDVLMSVDAGHRKEVCKLLKEQFPDTQFVLTTHDPIWLRHMKTERLINAKSAVQFRNWDVAQGPAEWNDRDVWTEISQLLEQNDVRGAAGRLRHYLEFASAELCHRLRAEVQYRGDAQYQLGELLPPAISKLRSLFQRGKESANSWNRRDAVDEIDRMEQDFREATERSKAEEWQVNVAIHYNSWENLTKEDFRPVADSFRVLLSKFECSECKTIMEVTPERETPTAIRCECGRININLVVKPRGR